jgi:hypothetical protein
MKIQLLSDLHLEAHPHWRARPAPGADLLVLAGDIGSYQAGSLLGDADFGLGQFSKAAGWPVPVVFVPGNHEYDGLDFDLAHARLRASCERLGLLWLERQTLHGPWSDQAGRPVRLVGTTLWTDFDALHALTAPALQAKAREKAFRAANYYLQKTGTSRNGVPFLAPQVREQALVCQAWLKEQLQTPFEGSTVVVTHFAPSLLSADPRYGMTSGTAGFCNALDGSLAQAQLWLHGLLHAPSDYRQAGCRVVANPLGYARKNEQAHFRETDCLTV